MADPIRKCMGCREHKPKATLIRICCGELGVFIDQAQKHQGRGVYLCPQLPCLKRIQKNRAVERTFKRGVAVDFWTQLDAHIVENMSSDVSGKALGDVL